MAWIFKEKRTCPKCLSSERIIIFQVRDGFRLSCSTCAAISTALPALDAFFRAWGGSMLRHRVGAVIELSGVPHMNKGTYVESVPIRVLLSKHTALVMENKKAA